LVVGKAVVFVYLLVLCRGAFEIAIKTANTVAIRKLLDDDMISDAASVFNTSNYIGGALGAALAVPMMQYFGSTAVLGSCAVLFLIGGILAFSLSASDVSNVDHGEKLHPSVLDILLKRTVVSPEVAESLFMLFVVVTAFQSYHDAVRTVFPLAELGMGESGVGLLQALTFVSLMFSAFFYSKFLSDSGRLSGTRDASLMLLACLFLNLSAAGMGAFVSLASYFFFIFFFELAYIQSTRRILLFTSRDEIVSVSSIQWLVVSLGMIVGTISIANLVEHFGMVVTNLLVSAVVIAWVIFDSLRKRERERAKRSQPA
jgi:predicted MFS family arabinose efflux permease